MSASISRPHGLEAFVVNAFVAVAVVIGIASAGLFMTALHGALGDPFSLTSFRRLYAAGVGLSLVMLALLLTRRDDAASGAVVGRLVVAAPLSAMAAVIGFVAVFGAEDPTFLHFVAEDGPVEWLTAIIEFAAGALFTALAWRAPREWPIARVFFLCCGAVALFIGGSEISFGQRLLGIETPQALAQVNRQNEISLHNIIGVERFVYRVMPFILLAGGFADLWARPLLRRALNGLGATQTPETALLPNWRIGMFFVPMAAFAAYALHFEPHHAFKLQEPAELVLGAGLLAVAIDRAVWLTRRDR